MCMLYVAQSASTNVNNAFEANAASTRWRGDFL